MRPSLKNCTYKVHGIDRMNRCARSKSGPRPNLRCCLRSTPSLLPEAVTAMGGVPLVVQAFRSLGLPGSVKQHVHIKQRQRGYDEATLVESFVILNAVGGEC